MITSLALGGIIFSQFFWMNKSYHLRREQFENKVRIALKSTVNQLMEHNRADMHSGCQSFCCLSDTNIQQTIHPDLLDSLIRHELDYYQIPLEYEYGVFNCARDSVIMGKTGSTEENLLQSPLFTPLSCLWKRNCYNLGIYFPGQQNYLLGQMGVWFFGSIFLILILVSGYFLTIFMIMRQKKLSEMKTDFMNNMTHEFKTPISTISASCELLTQEAITSNPEKVKKYARIIFDENNRLKGQVDRALQAALLDQQTLSLNLEPTDAHEAVNEVITNYGVHFRKSHKTLFVNLNAEKTIIHADRHHLINIIANLIENGIKYTEGEPKITVTTWNDDSGIFISVEDNGIGISKENLRQIFSRFYRVSTGNVHNVKGFGLGLYYVKTLVDAMNGSVSVQSEQKKGSTFTIFLPFSCEKQ